MREGTLFPQEVTSGVPRITLTGCGMLHIEQHRGLVAYQPEEVRIRTASGLLTIQGEGLYFRKYAAEEAIISGLIQQVRIGPEGGPR